jgi:hypothetical protein
MFRAIVGSALASVMVPFAQIVMTDEAPAGMRLAERMAARREPGPASFRLLTTNVFGGAGRRLAAGLGADDGTLQLEGAAMAGPVVKATAAQTPASKPAAAAIGGANRPARIIRLFMKTIYMVLSSFLAAGDSQLKVFAVGHAVNHEDNSDRHSWCNEWKTVKSNYFGRSRPAASASAPITAG